MSESVRYAARLSGGAGQRLAQGLGQAVGGVHDAAAWERARQQLSRVAQGLAAASAASVAGGLEASARESRRQLVLDRLGDKLRAEPVLSRLVQQVDGSVQGLVDGLSGMAPVDAQARLNGLVRTLADRLAAAERQVLRQTLEECLVGLGYRVDNRGGMLRATLKQTCVWAALDETGALRLDLSGFSGLSCLEELARLTRALKAQGVNLERQGSAGRIGGALIDEDHPVPIFSEGCERENKGRDHRMRAQRLMVGKGSERA